MLQHYKEKNSSDRICQKEEKSPPKIILHTFQRDEHVLG